MIDTSQVTQLGRDLAAQLIPSREHMPAGTERIGALAEVRVSPDVRVVVGVYGFLGLVLEGRREVVALDQGSACCLAMFEREYRLFTAPRLTNGSGATPKLSHVAVRHALTWMPSTGGGTRGSPGLFRGRTGTETATGGPERTAGTLPIEFFFFEVEDFFGTGRAAKSLAYSQGCPLVPPFSTLIPNRLLSQRGFSFPTCPITITPQLRIAGRHPSPPSRFSHAETGRGRQRWSRPA